MAPAQSRSSLPARIHLRVKHPRLDPKEITRVLSMTPEHTLDAGRRASVSTAESYWIAPLDFSGIEDAWRDPSEAQADSGMFAGYSALSVPSDESIVGLALRRLQAHQRFFRSIADEGGTATLLINVNRTGSMAIPPALARRLADLGLTLELDWSDGVE
jgi:hypothetical protein